MKKIIVLVGCSASGKDFILKHAVKYIEGLKGVVSHTSRPMRQGEIEGREYYFVDIETITDMHNNGEFIESRNYYVGDGVTWSYGIHKGSIDTEANNDYIVIVDLQGLKKIEKYFENLGMKDCIHSIFIDTDSQIRLQRSLSREGRMSEKQVAEVVRRYEDDKIFIEPAREYCDISLKNNSIENGLQILNYIRSLVEGR